MRRNAKYHTNTITFATIERNGRSSEHRGFAFYTTKDREKVFVHIKDAYQLEEQDGNLHFTHQQVHQANFPDYIVLTIEPGNKAGRLVATAWAPAPECSRKAHANGWCKNFPVLVNPERYIGGKVFIRNQQLRRGRWRSYTLQSLVAERVNVVLRMTDGTSFTEKWDEFAIGEELPNEQCQLTLERRGLTFTFYPAR